MEHQAGLLLKPKASALVGAPPDVAFIHEFDLPVDDLPRVT